MKKVKYWQYSIRILKNNGRVIIIENNKYTIDYQILIDISNPA